MRNETQETATVYQFPLEYQVREEPQSEVNRDEFAFHVLVKRHNESQLVITIPAFSGTDYDKKIYIAFIEKENTKHLKNRVREEVETFLDTLRAEGVEWPANASKRTCPYIRGVREFYVSGCI